MDISLHLYEIFCYALILLALYLYVAKTRAKGAMKTHKLAPEPAGALPFLGHLRLLGTGQLLHRTLGAMADKYGPIFGMRLGANKALVVSNWEVAKECFTLNDKIFSTRPRPLAVKITSYDDLAIPFAPYGPYWRDLRKITMAQLLSTHRVEMSKNVRDAEINHLILELYKKCAENDGLAVMEMKESFEDLSINLIMRSISGKRFDENDEESRNCRKYLTEGARFLGKVLYSDAIPILGWLDVLNGSVGELKRIGKELDSLLGSWVREHRRKKLAIENGDERKQAFMDVLLSAMDDGRPSEEVDTIMKATYLSLISGGSETTASTLTWALSLLLNNTHVMKKAKEELDLHVGKHRQVAEADINNLTYIRAIIKETLRLYPPAPLSLPRVAMEDCDVAGFHVPKGTLLQVNLWKLHRDPRIWQNPSDFVPERFFEENVNLDVRGQDFEYLPFGSGRRMCPGVTLASQVLHLALARLIHAFEIRTVSDKPIDMSEDSGLVLLKETPLEVMLTPRLPATAYVE